MSDSVVVYVTRSGHSRDLAKDLGTRLGAEVREIVDLSKRKGILAWINSGRQAAMKSSTPIGDPGIELQRFGTVVLVQPVWASAICPPLRTWLRAHARELAGKRLAILASCYGTAAGAIRAAFDAEFGAELGPLAACATVLQKNEEGLRKASVDAFVHELLGK
jgi:hypothetical protein